MKLALLVSLALDRRSGQVVSGIMPADQAIRAVKNSVESGECPDARFPILQAVSIESRLREHRFKVSAEQVADAQRDADDADTWIDADDLIKVELGEGAEIVVIQVTTEAEASFIRELASSAAGAGVALEKLRGLLEEARAQASGVATANQRLATFEADLAARDALIADLESQMAAAKQLQTNAADTGGEPLLKRKK